MHGVGWRKPNAQITESLAVNRGASGRVGATECGGHLIAPTTDALLNVIPSGYPDAV